MPLTTFVHEQTTAATDVLLAVYACYGALKLRRHGSRDAFKAGLWSPTFILLAGTALLGAMVHGLELANDLETFLWQSLYLSLGLVIALFGAGVLHDLKGPAYSRRLLPILLAAGIGFYSVTWLMGGDFLVFDLYASAAMVAVMLVYVRLGGRDGCQVPR